MPWRRTRCVSADRLSPEGRPHLTDGADSTVTIDEDEQNFMVHSDLAEQLHTADSAQRNEAVPNAKMGYEQLSHGSDIQSTDAPCVFKQCGRWHRPRSHDEGTSLASEGSQGAGLPVTFPTCSSNVSEDDLLNCALMESLQLSQDANMPLDALGEGLEDWSMKESNDDYMLLQALEASIHEQDLWEAKQSWAEAAKLPDTNPPPRSQLAASLSNAATAASEHASPPNSITTASARSKRRARRRSENRAEISGHHAASAELAGCVVLVREDCRLHDNPALQAAAEEYDWVIPVYIHDEDDPSPWPVRGAGLWWRYSSLKHFDVSLRRLGSQLILRRGSYVAEVVNIILDTQASALHFNRQLEPWHHRRDLEVERVVRDCLGKHVRSFKGMVLSFEPWEVKDRSNPKSWVDQCAPTVKDILAGPANGWPNSIPLAELGYGHTAGRKIPLDFRQFNAHRQAALEGILLEHTSAKKKSFFDPKVDDWAFEMAQFWKMGEETAMARLEEWIGEASWGCYFPPGLNPRDSAGGRFRADRKWTAILSPYLRFGNLSARYVYWRCRQALPHDMSRLFLKRVFLRDKAYAQLYKWPDSHSKSIRPQYEKQVWSGTAAQLKRWQRGETGFPLVDAAMRQLWKVGWICNHLRHVTAQFLIEHLDLSWKDGFAWYDYTLVDTDVAINAMMWQMGGHSGVGSWNFVMHPIYAGKKVDPEGAYVRRWLPELAGLPVEYIHTPWEAPLHAQLAGNVFVNDIYWQRIITDLVQARLAHQRNVIALRKQFPQFVKDNGNEIIILDSGEVLAVGVRDDIRENQPDKLSLMMTADDPRSNQRRKLVSKNGVHTSLIFEESKRIEAMYDM